MSSAMSFDACSGLPLYPRKELKAAPEFKYNGRWNASKS